MTAKQSPEEIAKQIINEPCLIPNPDAITESSCLTSCHEKMFGKCCCQLRKEIAQAIAAERARPAVMLPDRRDERDVGSLIGGDADRVTDYRYGWNDCLEEIARLNPARKEPDDV